MSLRYNSVLINIFLLPPPPPLPTCCFFPAHFFFCIVRTTSMKFLKKATEFFLNIIRDLNIEETFCCRKIIPPIKEYFQSPETRKMDGILVTSFNQA